MKTLTWQSIFLMNLSLELFYSYLTLVGVNSPNWIITLLEFWAGNYTNLNHIDTKTLKIDMSIVSFTCVHHCHICCPNSSSKYVLQSNFTTHKCVRYQDLFLTEAKFAANKYPLCQKKCFKHWFSPEANTRTLPNYEQQQEKKKLPHALIALIVQNLNALNVLIALISFPKKWTNS